MQPHDWSAGHSRARIFWQNHLQAQLFRKNNCFPTYLSRSWIELQKNYIISIQQNNKHKHNLPQHDSVRISSRLLTRWIATIKGCRLGCLCSCQHRLIQSSCWWSDGCHLGVPSFHIRQTMGTPETMGASTKKTNTSKHACSKMGQCPQKRMRLQLCYAFPQLGSSSKIQQPLGALMRLAARCVQNLSTTQPFYGQETHATGFCIFSGFTGNCQDVLAKLQSFRVLVDSGD